MQLTVREVAKKNIGQTVSFDYDPNGGGKSDPELIQVAGILEGYKKTQNEVILVVAGEEFPLTPDEGIDMIRSSVLARLHFIENAYFKDEDPKAHEDKPTYVGVI